MNRFLTLAALSGVVALSACANTPGSSSPFGGQPSFGVRPATGDQFTVVVNDKQTANFFGQAQTTEITTTMGLDVLRGGADQRWRWQYADFSVQQFEMDSEELAGLDFKQLMGIAAPAVRLGTMAGFECKVDRAGHCIELTNWPQWRGAFEDTVMLLEAAIKIGMAMEKAGESAEYGDHLEQLPSELSGLGDLGGLGELDQRTLDLMVNIVLNLLDGVDAKSAGPMALSGVIGMPAIQGLEPRVGGALPFTQGIPLPYGGGNLVLNGTQQVESVDRAAGAMTVVRSSELDGKALFASILTIYDNLVTPNLKAFAAYAPEDGASMVGVGAMGRAMLEQAFEGSTLTFKETTRGTVDLKTGMAREAVTTYTLEIKGGGDFDWIEGSLSGTQTVTVTAGAPVIPRLQRREIAPPPPPEAAPQEEAAPAPVPPPPRQRPRNAPRPKR